MAKLSKRLIKKYGISKRAWAEFRKEKSGRKRSPAKRTRAKTRASRRRTVKKQKRSVKKTNFNFGGGLGKGIAAGAAVGIINKFLPINIAGVDYIIAGMVMKEPMVQKIGAITLGRSLAGSITGGILGGAGGGNGGMVR